MTPSRQGTDQQAEGAAPMGDRRSAVLGNWSWEVAPADGCIWGATGSIEAWSRAAVIGSLAHKGKGQQMAVEEGRGEDGAGQRKERKEVMGTGGYGGGV